MQSRFCRKAAGLMSLFRIVPVLAWSISSVVLGLGMALYHTAWPDIKLSYLGLLFFVAALFQGLASHAINDIYDWISGTDRFSPGILSGGTAVIKNGCLSICDLKIIGWLSMLMGTAGGLYLVWVSGPFLLLLLLVGIWAAVGYTMPPVRLAYRPLVGEWLAAWPAMLAVTLGTFYVLTGTVALNALAAGILHATFSVAWLMQHHLPDIDADLKADPRKVTTVALVTLHWGKERARYVVVTYFLLLVFLGLYFGWQVNSAYFLTPVCALACIFLAYSTDPHDIQHITTRQLGMIIISIAHAVSLAVLFAFRVV